MNKLLRSYKKIEYVSGIINSAIYKIVKSVVNKINIFNQSKNFKWEDVMKKIMEVGKVIYGNKMVQGFVLASILFAIGLYAYDPIMNYIYPPVVIVPDPWYVKIMFWK